MPGYSFFKSEGENYGNVKSIYTRDIRYYLSKTACLGILRRAEARGKELPPQLRDALMIQAGLA